MTAYHVGIDLHKSVAQVCIRNAQGEIHGERRLPLTTAPERERLLELLESLGPRTHLAVEALGCNRWFVLACQVREMDILVVDPTKLDLKRTGAKTDKRDAREISRRLYLGDLKRHARTYFPTEAEYATRKLVRVKHRMIQMRTSLVAQIRGILNAYALRAPSGTLYTRDSLAWLRSLSAEALPEEDLRFALRMLIYQLAKIQRAIAKIASRIRKKVKADADVLATMQDLPGAGEQTILTIQAELGDPTRFRKAREVAAYGGLVARVTASADRSHHGRLTKRGNRELRFIMGQWAVRLLHRDPTVKRWAEPLLVRMHKNKVRMALARRLLVSVWVMLARGEEFSLEACLGLRT